MTIEKYDFLRVRDSEPKRFWNDRLGALMMYHHLTDKQCETVRVRVDQALLEAYLEEPFDRSIYTGRADDIVEEMLNSPNEKVRNVLATFEECVLL